MTLTHTFETDEKKDQLFHAFVFLNAAQCAKRYWTDDTYGIERTNALRYLEHQAHKTDWVKAMAAINLYCPRLVEVAKVNTAYFLEHYPNDPIYLAYPQVFAVVAMLDKMKAPPVAVSVPVLSKPPKTKKKK